MDQELQQLVSRLFSVAGSKGLSSVNPVSIVLEAPSTHADTQVIIRHDEPHTVTAPLNIVWLVADDQSPDYGKIFKRQSRIASTPYQHSWTELTTHASVFAPPQVWDTQEPADQDHVNHANNIDNPHRTTAEQTGALPITGGSMEGPLNLRSVSSVDDFGLDEPLPKSYVKTEIDTLKSTTTTLNSRIGGLQGAINYIINTLIKNLTNRVTVLEGTVNTNHESRISALEAFSGEPGFVHSQSTPEVNWSINHSLETLHVIVQVFDVNNKLMLPADVEIVDTDNINVSFAIPESGFVRIQSLTGVA